MYHVRLSKNELPVVKTKIIIVLGEGEAESRVRSGL
jgi:hypothetical protein